MPIVPADVRQRTDAGMMPIYIGRSSATSDRQPESSMKSKVVVCALVALSLTLGGFSFAQGNGYENRNDGERHGLAKAYKQQDQRDKQERKWQQRQDREQMRNNRHWNERGAGPEHQFYRGDRLPMEYRSRVYVVDDWRGHYLSAPPRGYHWVQTGADYVLVAIATGIILQLLLGQ